MDPQRPNPKRYGYEHLVRPNRNRRKTTVYLSPEDRARIDTIQNATGEKTTAGAIRHALKMATDKPSDTVMIGHRILDWATRLQFKSARETRELYRLSAELYKLESLRRAAFPGKGGDAQ